MAGLRILQRQLRAYDGVFKDHVAAAHAQMNTTQRNINRPESFTRMKDTMYSHVNRRRLTMFQQSVDQVQERLLAMLRTLEQFLEARISEALGTIRHDYTAALIGHGIARDQLPQIPWSARKDIMRIIDTVDDIFGNLASLSQQHLTSEDRTCEAALGSTLSQQFQSMGNSAEGSAGDGNEYGEG
ncbi:MAG: hypothetical protein Q9171_001519 [Xanthocarpia ochracea]